MRIAGKFAIGLASINIATLVTVAAVTADDSFWGQGRNALPANAIPASSIARMLEGDRNYRILGFETHDGLYDIKAVDAEGRRIRISVDAVTGAILR